MKLNTKKSLYVGLAALSMVAATGFAATNASAKTYATVTSNSTLTTDPTTRNVATNGTNALYTKAGTLRGARVVAGKATLAQYGSSNSSQQYFRAYRVATTNRGSVYYKVVSFNGNLRGWIYGGQSTSAFGGGISSANTMTQASLPSVTKGYTLTNVAKNSLWVNPKWSQYKAQPADMSGYKSGDTFTITGAATKTREGWLYYQVTDDNNSAVTGWVFAGGLTAPTTQPSTPTTPTTTPTKDNSIQIVYLNAGGQQVGQTYNWIIQNSDLKSGAKLTNGAKLGDILTNPAALTDAANKNVPSGYTISKSQPNNPVANVTVGSNYTVYVDQKVQSYTSQLSYYDSDSGQPISSSSLVEGIYPVFNDTDKAVFTSSTQGQLPASVFDNNVFKTGNLATLTGNAVNIGGKLLTPTWNFDATKTKQANANAKYGDTVKLYYKANPLS
ncbi:hypothetical protein [Lentilactobacillus farraginis]|uniref:S-layer protein n=2 Tax=Lentilactobacillus farraginis DSM 18382 = JCM 14108 TaxID=1423743 RepID=A0A0R1W0I5_9LACO|nr:hypothetical protein [Lentilactobacillus farraginis]KRM08969.1 S-layer protein [Lentilactobacillus farraginis DSM 18382 = JCM 14108]